MQQLLLLLGLALLLVGGGVSIRVAGEGLMKSGMKITGLIFFDGLAMLAFEPGTLGQFPCAFSCDGRGCIDDRWIVLYVLIASGVLSLGR